MALEVTMVRTQIQMTEEQITRLKQVASKENISMAKLIRQAVDSFVDSRVGVDREERRRRAIEAAGRFHSKKSDLAIDHDKYLAEAYGE